MTVNAWLPGWLLPDPRGPVLTWTTGISVASYNLGCFIGAVATIFIGNPLGRKRMILLGTSIMVVGAILMASATTLEHFIIGRIITGLGNGGNTSTVRC